MKFQIIKRRRGWEVFTVTTTYEPLDKVFQLPLSDIYSVFTSVVIPEERVASESAFFTNALYQGIKLIEDHQKKGWRKDFGQI